MAELPEDPIRGRAEGDAVLETILAGDATVQALIEMRVEGRPVTGILTALAAMDGPELRAALFAAVLERRIEVTTKRVKREGRFCRRLLRWLKGAG
jgi:hypothetical protein